MSNDNNPPAFPTPAGHAQVKDYHPGHGDVSRTVEICTTGMTLRDYFAAKALQGICSNSSITEFLKSSPDKIPEAMSEMAYGAADAMLVRRQKGQPHA
jgi:hypothetical protein